MSKDNYPRNGLPLFDNTKECISSNTVNRQRCSEANSQEDGGTNNISSDSTIAAILFSEEIKMQIQQMPDPHSEEFCIPGAYHMEGQRPGGPQRDPSRTPMITRGDRSEILHTLDAEIVQEDLLQPERATSSSRGRSRLPTSEVVDAMILPDRVGIYGQERKAVNTKLLCFVSCFMFNAGAILFLILFASKGSHTEEIISSPSAAPSVRVHYNQQQPPYSQSIEQLQGINATVYPPFQDTLPKALLLDIGDPTSPFYMANLWMLSDPNLNSYSPERQRQRFYLAMLYHATNGDHWLHRDHWMSYNISECDWYSHSSLPKDSPYYFPNTCNKNETLTSLSLAGNNLTGSLPLFPTLLIPQLRAFDVDNNNISGPIPPAFSGPDLEVFIVSNNDLTGSWRTADGIFDFKLKVLKNNGNCLTTGSPDNQGYFLFMLQHTIEVLNSTDNCFDGSLPTEVGLATNLLYYCRGDNDLIGTLPSELGLLTSLQHLDIGGNARMNGTIPAELAGMTALTDLDIAGTSISGPIPMDLCAQVTLKIERNCSLLGCCM